MYKLTKRADPVHVARVGLKASGLPVPGSDGTYKCVTLDREQRCVVFAHHANAQFSLARWESAHCARAFAQPSDDKECWVALASANGGNATPQAVQFDVGLLPRPVAAHDRNEHQWRKLADDGTWRADGHIQVAPDTWDGRALLGYLDTLFMLAYTFGMVYAGRVADHVEIRYLLAAGLFFAGVFSCLMGAAKALGTHSFWYFALMSIGAGLSQSVGWPCVVAVMSRWFTRSRGTLLGAWNSHQALGNALGSIIATRVVGFGMHGHDWPLGYEVPGYIAMGASLVVLAFLETDPAVVALGAEAPVLQQALLADEPTTTTSLLADDVRVEASVLRALRIPNVLPFCVCLFFAKMNTNSFLFWGPLYLANDVGFSNAQAGYLSSFLDVGGCLGGILAGVASDRARGKHGTVALCFLLAAAPMLVVYYKVTNALGPSTGPNVAMMIVVALLVNGPVALITTAVSADLGNHPSLKNDKRLAATVAGIIDASGSMGSAIQGALIGTAISQFSWASVWIFLAMGSLAAAACLVGVVRGELASWMGFQGPLVAVADTSDEASSA